MHPSQSMPNYIIQEGFKPQSNQNSNNNNLLSYTIPVTSNFQNNSNSNVNSGSNRNNFNISVSTSSSSPPGNNTNNASLMDNYAGYSIRSNMAKPSNTNNQVEDEVDLLKDLLMKNLNTSTTTASQSGEVNSHAPTTASNTFFGYCMRCNEKIIGAENGLRAMEALFHVACFNCYACGAGLQGKHFYAMDENSYCETCYTRLLEKCSICYKPITERVKPAYFFFIKNYFIAKYTAILV